MKVGVVTFPGTLEAADATRAVQVAGAQAVQLWHEDTDLQGVDAVILPGGATHGNYVRPGALAALSPIVGVIKEAAADGLPVLGLGNGFQILCEAGLLPGAFVSNAEGKYICKDTTFKVENNKTAWTSKYDEGAEVTLPLRTGFGLYAADPQTLQDLEDSGRVVLRYNEDVTGSANAIAGLANEAGNVVGMMASVDHAVEAGFGTGTPGSHRGGTDGLAVFESVELSLQNK
ncbi:MAG: phosphoribosylformylglycinamidine synthase subunit PurQ [Actinomycetaceae bacterium]|nr:phosphoribosylformylglycinamidine synthase subunit PurQ [Actinomycetaceae bacterium]